MFRHNWTYSCISRHIQNTLLIQACLEPVIYLASFRHIIQVLLRSNLCIFRTLFRQIEVYLNSGLFRHVMFHVYADIFSTLEYVIKQRFMQKKNFQTCNQKCLVCEILGFKFKKLLSYFKAAISNL